MAIWSRLTAAIAGIAIGEAGAAAIEPVLEQPKQQAWKDNTFRILDLGTLAHLVAQGLVDETAVVDEAARNGYDENKLKARIQLELKAPPLAEVLTLWRRGRFGTPDPANPPEQVTHALAKEQIESQYWPAVLDLFFERVSVQDVAVMVQRGILPNPGWLPVGPPTVVGKVPPMPEAKFDPVAEAQAQGFDADRAAALAKIIGLPASPDLAARMTFRGIIDQVDFDRAIAEGNTRNEWAPFLFDGFRQILTAHDYAELDLRGFLTHAERDAGTAKHGMSAEDSQLLYDVIGRAPSPHAIRAALARGAKYPAVYADVPEPYRAAIQRSNIREEFADIAYRMSEGYPSGFQIRSEAKTGELSTADTQQILLEIGWSPKWATFFAQKWTGVTATAGPAKLTTEDKAAIRAVGKSYTLGEIDRIAAEAELVKIGLTSADWDPKFLAWDVTRESTFKRLSDAGVKKAIKSGRYTLPEAISILVARGFTEGDALTFLTE